MGKRSNRKASRTSTANTAADVAASNSIMNNLFAQNPMHTREQGEASLSNLLGGMMSNIDSFVDKMDSKVAGVMGSNPAMQVFNQQAADNGTPVQMPQQPPPQQAAPAPAPQEPAPPPPQEPVAEPQPQQQMPAWMQRLPPETQQALMKWQGFQQDRLARRDARRERLGLMGYQPQRFEL